MHQIFADELRFLVNVLMEFLVLGVILAMIFIRRIRKRITEPIIEIAGRAERFIESDPNGEAHEATFQDITVNTQDEIHKLLTSLQKMEIDINGYIGKITEVTKQEERIQTELGIATRIQADLLPDDFHAFSDLPGIAYYATMRPAKEVGGDFYDFFRIDETHLAFVIADVSGKGVPAALMMANAMTRIHTRALLGGSPAQILKDVNLQLCEGNKESMFVTAWLGILDVTTGELKTSNAGHEYPAICHAGGAFELIRDKHGLALGAMDLAKYTDETLLLEPGDTLYLYTDGIPEANNEKEELLGTDRMLLMLDGYRDRSLEESLKGVLQEIDKFSGQEPQFDDMTQLMIRYTAGNETDSMEYDVWKLLERNEERQQGLAHYENLTLPEGSCKLLVEAKVSQLEEVNDQVSSYLENTGASMKTIMQVQLSLEEAYVNVANYAYPDGEGKAMILLIPVAEGRSAIVLVDEGTPYDPLAKEDPDLTLSAEEREIGGLGIFLVRKNMDDVKYRYQNGCNILVMYKNI